MPLSNPAVSPGQVFFSVFCTMATDSETFLLCASFVGVALLTWIAILAVVSKSKKKPTGSVLVQEDGRTVRRSTR